MRRFLKWFLPLVVVLFVLVAVVNVLKPKNTNVTPSIPSKPVTVLPALSYRQFAMGFVPIPVQPLTQENWLAGFELFGQSSEVIMQHRHFAAAEAESLDLIAKLTASQDLKLFVVIDPLSDNRKDLDPTLKKLGRSFSDPAVRERYRQVALEAVEKYRPAYLSFGSEMNTYLAKYPKEILAYQSLVAETSQAIKALAPQTITTISFQYETLSGAYGEAQWETLTALEPLLDRVAFTTYPNLVFKHPSDLPADYYAVLTKYTNKPLMVAESGWPSGNNARDQAAFVESFSRALGELPVELWVWWFPHDWGSGGYGATFATMGLRTSTGEPKAAWPVWQAIFALPH